MQSKFFNIKFPVYLFPLLIPLLITGPFIPDLLVSLSSIIFLFYIFIEKDFKIFQNIPLNLFFIFCIFITIASLQSENVFFSLKSSLFYFRIGVFSFILWFLIEKDPKILNYFYYALCLSFLAIVIDGYIQFFFDQNIFGFPKSTDRISSFFGDELIMGSYLSRLFPLLIALFVIKSKSNIEIYFAGILFVSTGLLIYLSGERAAFAMFVLSIVFIFFLTKGYKKFKLYIVLPTLILILIFTFSNAKVKNRMILGPLESMGLNEPSKKKYIFTPEHDSLIRTSFNMFLDKPIIGHGPKMFRIKCSEHKYATGIWPCATHPHNFYVQLLGETGLVGFSFLILFFLYILNMTIKQIKSLIFKKKSYLSDYQVCLLSSMFITLWPITPNGNFFNNWLMIVYCLPVGFYLHSVFGKNKNILIN